MLFFCRRAYILNYVLIVYRMRVTVKNFVVSLCLMVGLLIFVGFLDDSMSVSANQQPSIRVIVTDINDNVVHNAFVTVGNSGGFYTDDKGYSPVIRIDNPVNCHDNSITDWYTATVTVRAEGYVDTVVVNCVLYSNETRVLTVRIYPKDSSDLPVVCYVESPPESYLKDLFQGQK